MVNWRKHYNLSVISVSPVTLHGSGKALMESLLALEGTEMVSSILVQCLNIAEPEFKSLNSRFSPPFLKLNTRGYRH